MSTKTSIAGRKPRYLLAIGLHMSGMTWLEVAEQIGVDVSTIYRWRRSPDWQEALIAYLTGSDVLETAIRRLKQSADGEPGSPGVTAAQFLLERTLGKAPERVEHTGTAGGPLEIVVIDNATHSVPEAASVSEE